MNRSKTYLMSRMFNRRKCVPLVLYAVLAGVGPLPLWATAAEVARPAIPKELIRAGEAGDAQAQTEIGVLYAEGDGVTQDYKKALAWLERAGKQGYADAEYNLGVMFGNGDGIPRDTERAMTWFEKAAEHGHVGARYNLGVIYSHGLGVEKDLARAERWFTLAAEQGSAEDQYTLGVMFSEGESLNKDTAKARKWFGKAATGGHVLAQYNLAVMFSEGLGGRRDREKARYWANRAADGGDPQAERLLIALDAENGEQKKGALEELLLTGALAPEAETVVPPARLKSAVLPADPAPEAVVTEPDFSPLEEPSSAEPETATLHIVTLPAEGTMAVNETNAIKEEKSSIAAAEQAVVSPEATNQEEKVLECLALKDSSQRDSLNNTPAADSEQTTPDDIATTEKEAMPQSDQETAAEGPEESSVQMTSHAIPERATEDSVPEVNTSQDEPEAEGQSVAPLEAPTTAEARPVDTHVDSPDVTDMPVPAQENNQDEVSTDAAMVTSPVGEYAITAQQQTPEPVSESGAEPETSRNEVTTDTPVKSEEVTPDN